MPSTDTRERIISDAMEAGAAASWRCESQPDVAPFVARINALRSPVERGEGEALAAGLFDNARELREVVDLINLCIYALEGRDGADVCTELAVAGHRIDMVIEAVALELAPAPNEPEPPPVPVEGERLGEAVRATAAWLASYSQTSEVARIPGFRALMLRYSRRLESALAALPVQGERERPFGWYVYRFSDGTGTFGFREPANRPGVQHVTALYAGPPVKGERGERTAGDALAPLIGAFPELPEPCARCGEALCDCETKDRDAVLSAALEWRERWADGASKGHSPERDAAYRAATDALLESLRPFSQPEGSKPNRRYRPEEASPEEREEFVRRSVAAELSLSGGSRRMDSEEWSDPAPAPQPEEG